MNPSINSFKPHVPNIQIPCEPSSRPFRRQAILRSSDEKTKTARIPILPPKTSAAGNPRFKIHPPVPAETARAPRLSLNRLPNTPLSPQEAVNRYGNILSSVEKFEITSFPEVYFLGTPGKKRMSDKFDDSEHHYIVNIGDHLAYRYEILSVFGKGCFGQVLKCYDHKQKIVVAVKVIISTQQMIEQASVEASALGKLNKVDGAHFVKAYDFFVFRNHPCITFECLSQSLRGVKLTPLYAKSIIHQLFSSLVTMKRCGIIHCDIKPENLLYSDKTNVKLIDFGASCANGKQKYFYIQSRHYRAPEVILGCGYSFPIDTWSAAIVAIEVATGRLIFPGRNELEMMKMFIEAFRLPPIHMLRGSRKFSSFFDIRCRPIFDVVPGSHPLQELVGAIDPLLFDVVSKCLRWDPNERLSPEEVLNHPYFKGVGVSSNLPELRSSQNNS